MSTSQKLSVVSREAQPSDLNVGASTNFDSHLNNIDFMRLALALLVIFAHSFPVTQGNNDAEPFMRITRGQATGGHIAVDSFFILSGFLITASYQRSSSVFSYLKKRIARIYPGFLVVTLIEAFCFVPLSGGHLASNIPLEKAALISSSVLRLKDLKVLGAFPTNPFPGIVNASLWTISYEFLCYFGVAVLGLTTVLRRRGIVAGLFGTSILFSLLYAHFDWHFPHSLPALLFGFPKEWARLAPMYLAGVVIYVYRDVIRLNGWAAMLCVPALAVACVLPLAYRLVFPLFGAYLLMYVAFWERLSLHRIMRFGDFSYGTYLYAFPVQQVVMLHFGLRNEPLRLFAIATPVVLAMAAMSWFFVERPTLRAGRRRSARQACVTRPDPVAEACD